jgi:hypothetical protein
MTEGLRPGAAVVTRETTFTAKLRIDDREHRDVSLAPVQVEA